MSRTSKNLFAVTAMLVALGAPARAAESHYQLVENWAQFPPGVESQGEGGLR